MRVGRCRVPVWPPLALAEAVSVSGHAKGRCCGKSRGAAASFTSGGGGPWPLNVYAAAQGCIRTADNRRRRRGYPSLGPPSPPPPPQPRRGHIVNLNHENTWTNG